MKKKLQINGQEIEVEVISKTNSSITFSYDGKEHTYSLIRSDLGKTILSDRAGKFSTVFVSKNGLYDNESGQYKIVEMKKATSKDVADKLNTLISPLPGKVIKVCSKQRSKVKEGDEIFRIEAMKMEHRICAQISGTLKAVNVKEGDTVQDGLVLGEIEL